MLRLIRTRFELVRICFEIEKLNLSDNPFVLHVFNANRHGIKVGRTVEMPDQFVSVRPDIARLCFVVQAKHGVTHTGRTVFAE